MRFYLTGWSVYHPAVKTGFGTWQGVWELDATWQASAKCPRDSQVLRRLVKVCQVPNPVLTRMVHTIQPSHPSNKNAPMSGNLRLDRSDRLKTWNLKKNVPFYLRILEMRHFPTLGRFGSTKWSWDEPDPWFDAYTARSIHFQCYFIAFSRTGTMFRSWRGRKPKQRHFFVEINENQRKLINIGELHYFQFSKSGNYSDIVLNVRK